MFLEFEASNFDEISNKGFVVLDFHAKWCGPCKVMANLITKADHPGVKIIKVDTDQQQEIASKYGVTAIPTMVFLKDGKEIDRLVGLAPMGLLQEKFEVKKDD